MSRDMFLQSAFQFSFLPSKPCLFPLKFRFEFVLHHERPKFVALPVKFLADRSKFQFCTKDPKFNINYSMHSIYFPNSDWLKAHV